MISVKSISGALSAWPTDTDTDAYTDTETNTNTDTYLSDMGDTDTDTQVSLRYLGISMHIIHIAQTAIGTSAE